MTVSVQNNRISYNGNGSTQNFAYNYLFQNGSDLIVILQDADGVDTTQVLNTDYTVTGAGTGTGNVAMITAPASGEKLIIYSAPAISQEVDLQSGSDLPEDSLEDALDKSILVSRYLNDQVGRSIKLKNSDTSSPTLEIPLLTDRASKVLGFDGDGNLIVTELDASSTSVTADGTTQSRTLAVRFSDTYNVLDFGALGNNVADDTDAIQRALNAMHNDSPRFGGILFFPKGYYRINAKLYTAVKSTRIMGENMEGTAIVGLTTDQTVLEIRHPYVEVNNMRIHHTGSSSIGIAVKGAGEINIRDVFIYPTSASCGTGLLLDENDYLGSFAAGSYFHEVANCLIGYDDDNYHTNSIRMIGSINNCLFINNQLISDAPVYADASASYGGSAGGGNKFIGGRIKSATGTIGTPVGTGITEINYVGNEYDGVYAEKLSTIYTAGNDTEGAILHVHNDNCTAMYSVTGTGQIPTSARDYSGTYLETHKLVTQTVTANSTALNTKCRTLVLSAAASYTNCTLPTSGINSGHRLTIINTSYPIQILNTNVIFVTGSASEYIGHAYTASNPQSFGQTMELVFNGTNWVELDRSSYVMSQATRSVNITSNGQNITEVNGSSHLDVGGASSRTGITIANGTLPGQVAHFTAGSNNTFAFATGSNVYWENGTAPTLSLTSTNTMSFSLMWNRSLGVSGMWIEYAKRVTA